MRDVLVVFQSESALYNCLGVQELLAQNRRNIWSLSDSNGIRTHNHLVRKWPLNHSNAVAVAQKVTFNENVSFADHASGIRLSDCSKLAINWKNNILSTWRHNQIFFGIPVFLLSSLATGPSFVSISLLVLELGQFLSIRDWPELQKSEIPLS